MSLDCLWSNVVRIEARALPTKSSLYQPSHQNETTMALLEKRDWCFQGLRDGSCAHPPRNDPKHTCLVV